MHHVEVNNVSKSYGKVTALSNVTFTVGEGELFGIIGPDGAGKTTLFRIMTSLLLPKTGTASVMGFDVVKDYKNIRSIIGYMPGKFSLYQDLSVEENLKFFAGIFGTTIEENYSLIKDIYSHIEPFKTRQAGKLSGGMKQKLALSCALIHKPRVLFLDEPTTGVDAVSRAEFWEMLRKICAEKITIVVSTPYMDEAALCDRIALIQNGHILDIDSPVSITKKFGKKLFALSGDNNYKLLKQVEQFDITEAVYPFGENIHWVVKPTIAMGVINEKINSLSGVAAREIEPCVEDCFMNLMRNKSEL